MNKQKKLQVQGYPEYNYAMPANNGGDINWTIHNIDGAPISSCSAFAYCDGNNCKTDAGGIFTCIKGNDSSTSKAILTRKGDYLCYENEFNEHGGIIPVISPVKNSDGSFSYICSHRPPSPPPRETRYYCTDPVNNICTANTSKPPPPASPNCGTFGDGSLVDFPDKFSCEQNCIVPIRNNNLGCNRGDGGMCDDINKHKTTPLPYFKAGQSCACYFNPFSPDNPTIYRKENAIGCGNYSKIKCASGSKAKKTDGVGVKCE